MTRIIDASLRTLLIGAASLAAACSDDATTPATDTTPDTTPADTAGDTTEPDTTAPDTTPGDTAVADTSPVDTGRGLCLGVIDTCVGLCDDAQCFETCITNNSATIGEAELATEYVACLDDNGCVRAADADTDGIRAGYACEQTNCLAERRECEQGGSAGAENCIPVGGCLADCDRDNFACYRGCFEDVGAEAAQTFLSLQFCVSVNCYELNGTPAAFQACAQNAIDEEGPCAPLRTACYGDTPGLQGIEFQPVYGSIPPNPWP
jgi:hypothetical protein